MSGATYTWRFAVVSGLSPLYPYTTTTSTDTAPTTYLGNPIDASTITLVGAPEVTSEQVTFTVPPVMSAITTPGGQTITLPSVNTTLVGTDTSDTLTNKVFLDGANTTFANATDPTVRVRLSITGPASTTLTLATAQTAGRTVTFPDATDTLVGRATTDTLSNKTLVDATTVIVDQADPTIKLAWNITGTTATTLTLATAQTAGRTITLPDATDTLVGKATTDVLTNKSLTDAIITLNASRPSAPTGGQIKMYTGVEVGPPTINIANGVDPNFALQTRFGARHMGWWYATGAGTTTANLFKFGNSTAGVVTAVPVSSTNLLTSTKVLNYVTTGVAGTSAGTRNTVLNLMIGGTGNTGNLGGFYYNARVGSPTTTNATSRSFVGLRSSTAILPINEPSLLATVNSVVAFISDSTDTNWRFMTSNGTTGAFINTGVPKSSSTAIFDFKFYCQPAGTTMYYSIETFTAGGSTLVSGSTSTNLPVATTFMCSQIWLNNGTTAAATAISVASQYFESDF